MKRTILKCAGLLAATSLVACSFVEDRSPPSGEPSDRTSPYTTTGLALTSDALADTDIETMQFLIDKVDCKTGAAAGFSDSATVDYEDMYLPGGIGIFENAPYDSESQHMFADSYFLLDAGCYNVKTQPLRAGGTPSKSCKPAHKDGVKVRDGKTTEILLINQCKGAARGGLDVLGTINHPPEIDDLEFQDSKFITSCQPKPQVCVTASDPDDDPLEFVWKATSHGSKLASIAPVGPPTLDAQTGQWTSCANVATGPKGDYSFRVVIFDLDGNGTRIERLLKQQDPRDARPSRDTLRFPMYAGVDCQGRSAVILMSLNNNPGAKNMGYASPFIQQAAQWVSPLSDYTNSNLLIVKDDNDPQNEHPNEDTYLFGELNAVFNSVTLIDEPAGGFAPNALDGYDVVWFFNSGYPMDDATSYDEMKRYLLAGGGLILQGDDMAGPALAGNRELSYFSHLNYLGNGVKTCGDTTNNNVGNNWSVKFANRPISILDGLRNKSFEYGNDIDHTVRQNSGEKPLAWATYQSGQCSKRIPAAVSIDPIDLP